MQIQQSLRKISRDVPESELKAFTCCPVCGSDAPRREVGTAQNAPKVSLLKCDRCKAVSTSHYANDRYLRTYYDTVFSDFYAEFNDNDSEVTFSNPNRFAKHIVKCIQDLGTGKNDFRILDFGGGDGALACAVAELLPEPKTILVDVVDYGKETTKAPSKRFHIRKFEALVQAESQYDLIIASASLEHVTDLQSILEDLLNRLNPGACFYLRTPYIVPLKRIVTSIDFSFPAHMHDLGVDFWSRVPELFSPDLELVRSAPSIIEIDWSTNWYRYLIAALLKLPAHIEFYVYRKKKFAIWPFVGGWEAIFKKPAGH